MPAHCLPSLRCTASAPILRRLPSETSFALSSISQIRCHRYLEDERLFRHFRLRSPDYLLLQQMPANPALLGRLSPTTFAEEGGAEKIAGVFSELFYFPATNVFRLLRLFKPGMIIAGVTFVVSSGAPSGSETVLHGQRCSETALDYTWLGDPLRSYTLLASDVPFFGAFSRALLPPT